MRWNKAFEGPRDGDGRIIKKFTFFPYQINVWGEYIWLETIYIKQTYFNKITDDDWREGWEDQYEVDKKTYETFKRT